MPLSKMPLSIPTLVNKAQYFYTQHNDAQHDMMLHSLMTNNMKTYSELKPSAYKLICGTQDSIFIVKE